MEETRLRRFAILWLRRLREERRRWVLSQVEKRWPRVGVRYMDGRGAIADVFVVFACQKAGRMPPPGWTDMDPNAKRYSPGDTSLMKGKADGLVQLNKDTD